MLTATLDQKTPGATHTFATGGEECIATIKNSGAVGGKRTITLTAAVHAITSLRLSFAAKVGGTHVFRVADADFNTATDRFDATSNLYQLSAASGQFDFDFTGIGELKIYATGAADGTMAMEVAA